MSLNLTIEYTDSESEEDDNDFVLKFSTDESDSEASAYTDIKASSDSSEYHSCDNLSDEKTDDRSNIVVKVRKLIRQLGSSRVVLQRLRSDSHSVKTEDQTKEPRKTKRYCSTCDITVNFTRTSTCNDCNSRLMYECAKCGVRYLKRSGVDSHIQTKCFNTVIYHCDNCEYTSRIKSGIKKHILRYHTDSRERKNKSYKCSVCKEKFLSSWEQRRHTKSCKQLLISELSAFEKSMKRYCIDCDKNMEYSANQCPDCKRSTRFYYCGACGRYFVSLVRLQFHLRSSEQCVTGEQRFQLVLEKLGDGTLSCPRCPLKFEARKTLMQHLCSCRVDVDEAPSTSRRKRRYGGVLDKTARKEVKLEPDSRKRKRRSDGVSDEVVRKRVKLDFQTKLTTFVKGFCPKCGEARRVLRKKNEKCAKCEGPLEFECSICSKQYSSISGIVYHLDKYNCQLTSKILQCNECDYTSNLVDTLIAHVKLCHAEPKDEAADEFSCENCEKKCRSKAAVEMHNRYCKLVPVKCEMCEYKTKYKYQLERHSRRFHSVDEPTDVVNSN